jgi:hypothetical protein
MGGRRIDGRRESGRRGLCRVAAWLGVVALLVQYSASLLPMPQFVAAVPSFGVARDAEPLPDCPYDDAGAPKGIPHPHRQCAVCLALHMAGTFLAPLPPFIAVRAASSGNPTFHSEILVADAAAFARPQPRAPPAQTSI